MVDGIRHLEIFSSLKRIMSPSMVRLVYVNVDESMRQKRLSNRLVDELHKLLFRHMCAGKTGKYSYDTSKSYTVCTRRNVGLSYNIPSSVCSDLLGPGLLLWETNPFQEPLDIDHHSRSCPPHHIFQCPFKTAKPRFGFVKSLKTALSPKTVRR